MPEPVTLIRGALPPALCTRWLQAAEAAMVCGGGVPPLSSLRLPGVPGIDIAEVLRAALASPLAEHIARRLGAAPLCNLDQCWLRRQAPPGQPGHRPHGWHQDGALGHDFMTRADDGGLLAMLTAWIALTPGGADAPALAWITAPARELLLPMQLTDAAVIERYGDERVATPGALLPGDVLLFDGTVLHRTQASTAMTQARTSLELRFFAAAPPRLAGQRFVALPA